MAFAANSNTPNSSSSFVFDIVCDIVLDSWKELLEAVASAYIVATVLQGLLRHCHRPRIGPSHLTKKRRRRRRRLIVKSGVRVPFIATESKRGVIINAATMQNLSPSGQPSQRQPRTTESSRNHQESKSSERKGYPTSPPCINRTLSTSSSVSVSSACTDNFPVLVYHESARSIVFRDHLRRAVKKEQQNAFGETAQRTVTTAYATELVDAKRDGLEYIPPDDMIHANDDSTAADQGGGLDSTAFEFANNEASCISNCFQPSITPLPKLALGPGDQMDVLIQSASGRDGDVDPSWTNAEREVVALLGRQQAIVKTVKNTEWTAFLHRFQIAKVQQEKCLALHRDRAPHEGHPFNSFLTSCSLLPPYGQKMRAYGSPKTSTVGLVFALPVKHCETGSISISEDTAALETKTWCWGSGYSAKTEFNRDSRGELINGREEALVSMCQLREYNADYLTKDEHMIAGRLVKALKVVPYNEILVRVGGHGRFVGGREVVSGEARVDGSKHGRSFKEGLGLPVALFVRTATYGHLISLIRTRARLMHVLGENQIKNIPLLLITPDLGVRVLTKPLEAQLLKNASQRLNPFQNPTIAHKTTIDSDGDELEQKLEELIELDDDVRKLLTREECARLAGGFGATDESVASLLRDAMMADQRYKREHRNDQCAGESHILQDIVNEGLASAVRAGDYYTSRQLLILYSLVAATATGDGEEEKEESGENGRGKTIAEKLLDSAPGVSELKGSINAINKNLDLPPPPPLDTDRLRGATNSDGLLSVFGAAQVLKAIQDGTAKRRVDEVILALDEWCEYGESSMAFRLASWRDQRGAQADLKIAMESGSSFMAFLSNKAVANRKAFVSQLKQIAQSSDDFCSVSFVSAILAILERMHSPCLRLELMQYVLGLDNRYSVAHVTRSVELAKTCLGLGNR